MAKIASVMSFEGLILHDPDFEILKFTQGHVPYPRLELHLFNPCS